MDAKRKESMSIMKKIMIAMATGILLGVVCLWLRESLTAGGNEGTWKLINRIFFQDITQEKGFYSLGLFYIIQQLFMRGLQLAIVPLVLSSLSLALCIILQSKVQTNIQQTQRQSSSVSEFRNYNRKSRLPFQETPYKANWQQFPSHPIDKEKLPKTSSSQLLIQ